MKHRHGGRARRGYTVSPKKLAANRANAAHSTGPRTAEGKLRSARNAMRHGILASPITSAALDGNAGCARFRAMLEGFVIYFQPMGGPEMRAVGAMTEAAWRHEATTRFERGAAYDAWRRGIYRTLGDGRPSQVLHDAQLDVSTIPGEHDAGLAARYFAMSDNAYYRAERSLERLKKSRGAPLAEGAELEVPPMEPPEYFVPKAEPKPPPPPPKVEVTVEDEIKKMQEFIRSEAAKSRAMTAALKGEELLDNLQQALNKQGIGMSEAQRAKLDPELLWPQLKGLPPHSPTTLARLIVASGIGPDFEDEDEDFEELDEDEEDFEEDEVEEAEVVSASTERDKPLTPAQREAIAGALRGDDEKHPKRPDYQTNPIASREEATADAIATAQQRKDGEDPPSHG